MVFKYIRMYKCRGEAATEVINCLQVVWLLSPSRSIEGRLQHSIGTHGLALLNIMKP